MVNWPQRAIVDEVESVQDLLRLLTAGGLDDYPTMIWRGVANIHWPLDSRLARRVIANECDGDRSLLTEDLMACEESRIIRDARRHQFDQGPCGRLTDLELLARLQHHGAATRLLDVTRNALLAAWFAVEDGSQDDIDGVIFGVDMTDSELPEERQAPDKRMQEILAGGYVWFWRPPAVDPRISAQQAAFLFSAIPGRDMKADTSLTTLALEFTDFNANRLFSARPGRGRLPVSPVVIIRIPHHVKRDLRKFLQTRLGYTSDVIYPDLAGFALSRGA